MSDTVKEILATATLADGVKSESTSDNAEVLHVDDKNIKASSIRDRFGDRSEIDTFLEELGVDDLVNSRATGERWNYKKDEPNDYDAYKDVGAIFEEYQDDEKIPRREQEVIDDAMETLFEERLGLTEIRAHDTGVMDVLYYKILKSMEDSLIADTPRGSSSAGMIEERDLQK